MKYIGRNIDFLAYSSHKPGRAGENMVKDGKLTKDWKTILDSLPSEAPWGNAMWLAAAKELDHNFNTATVSNQGQPNKTQLSAGASDLATEIAKRAPGRADAAGRWR